MRSAFLTFLTPFGRANRIVFLAGFGLLGFVGPALMILMGLLFPSTRIHPGLPLAAPYLSFSLLISVWITFCLFVNRLHDIDRTGVGALIPALLPLLGMGVMTGFSKEGFNWGVGMAIFAAPVLYTGVGALLLCFQGDPAPNRFGARPDFATAR